MDKEEKRFEIVQKIKELYAKYGCYNICVDGDAFPEMKFRYSHATNASVRFYPCRQSVEIILNSENPELLEEFFNLLADLEQYLQEKGYHKKDSSRFLFDLYILEMGY